VVVVVVVVVWWYSVVKVPWDARERSFPTSNF